MATDSLAAHYRTLRDTDRFEAPDFPVGAVPADAVAERFVLSNGGRRFAAAVDAGAPARVSVGVSATGPPHLGTLGQVETAIHLQAAGLDVQLVLAGLPAYLAAGREWARVRELVGRYRSLALALGFDPRAGTLRTQFDAPGVLRTAMLLSRYHDPTSDDDGRAADDAAGDGQVDDDAAGDGQVDDDVAGDGRATDDGQVADDAADDGQFDDDAPADSTAFEATLGAAYNEAETPGAETPAFAGHQTGLLLAADTLHPIVAGGHEHVCFVGGADNRGLAASVARTLAASPYEGHVAGLYTRLVPGADAPKQSKSLPGGLSLAADPAALRDRILGDGHPEGRALCEAMRLTRPAPGDGRPRPGEAFDRGGEAWDRARRAYADRVAEAAAAWG